MLENFHLMKSVDSSLLDRYMEYVSHNGPVLFMKFFLQIVFSKEQRKEQIHRN